MSGGGEAAPPTGGPGQAVGRVVQVSPSGTLATDLPGAWLRGTAWVEIGRRRVPVTRRIDDVAPGEGLARVGVHGRVEIAVRDGSAAAEFAVGAGDRVALVRESA